MGYIDRRIWLKQITLALTGTGISSALQANNITPFFSSPRPYKPGELLLLNSNENAYGPSPMAREAILQNYLSSNRYPDNLIPRLKTKIASHLKIHEDNILLGAGCSEIIGISCQLAAKAKGHIITAEPSYKAWNNQASSFGLSFKRNALPQKDMPDLSSLYGPINNETRMIYICNPNNPTGTILDTKQVEAFALSVPKQTLVFIDEAYAEYAQINTLAPIAIKNPNIIIGKTFSKIYGLAGTRTGYAIAHPQTIELLSAYQPWPNANVSAVSAAAAIASLDDKQFVLDSRENNNKAKELCYAAFKSLNLAYIPSHTNFILFNIDKIKGNFAEQMKSKNIEVQYREHYGGKWCRVSMGTVEEMQLFTNALKHIVT